VFVTGARLLAVIGVATETTGRENAAQDKKTLLKRYLASLPIVRPLALHMLRITSRDIRIKNPWSEDSMVLNSFKHKTYWYYRKDRELDTMNMFRQLITEGDTVIEVGGHIGFMTQFFSKLIGDGGLVVVFEPGSNNLPYIQRNTRKSNIRLETLAISNVEGETSFFEDNLSGQNNSLLSDYRAAEDVAKSHHMALKQKVRTVHMTTIDSYVRNTGVVPDFIKIDIEGNELNALRGAVETLSTTAALMVEVTENHAAVFDILKSQSFKLFNCKGEELHEVNRTLNVFALKHNVRVA
jgi:FkbM family methyltransferase